MACKGGLLDSSVRTLLQLFYCMSYLATKARMEARPLFVALLAYVLVLQMLAVAIAQTQHLGRQLDPAAVFDPLSVQCMPGSASTGTDDVDPARPAPDQAPHDICCTLPLRLDAVVPPMLIHLAEWTGTIILILRPMIGLDAISPRGPPLPLNPRAPPLSA